MKYTVFYGKKYFRQFNSEFQALYFIEEVLGADDWQEVKRTDEIMYFVG